MTETIKVVNNIPVNGIDVSHWNGKSKAPVPDWCQFYGTKAVHLGGTKMVNDVDPLFEYNRERAHVVRWSAMYLYLVADVPQVEQINKLAETVGELRYGECVFIDWEDQDITVLDEEAFYYLEAIYGGRWMMYVNDMTPSMTAWMNTNVLEGSTIPIMHPNWSPAGWKEAKKWDASVWQVGIEKVSGYKECIDVDLVIKPEVLDELTGLYFK